MGNEKEFIAGMALAIGLAIIPMRGWIYWSLAAVLSLLCVRLVWLVLKPQWARWLASAVTILILAVVLAPGSP